MLLPTIDILICTIGKRINRVPDILLPPEDGISYIVSHQTDGHYDYPQAMFFRSDVKVFQISGRGLSANRNNAISHSTADLMVISDDDTTLNSVYLQGLRKFSLQHPDTDIFTMMVSTPSGDLLHYYPTKSFRYPHVPKGFYYNSNEIVIRKSSRIPQFDTRFGLGAERLQMGEEEIFIYDCYKKGLHVEYHPYILQTIPNITTSSNYSTTFSLQESKGAVLTILHGRIMATARIIYTAFTMRHKIPFVKHVKNMFAGMRYILSTKHTI